MKTQSIVYVNADDLFKDCPYAWDVFVDCDPPCSWGDNTHSLVTKDVIRYMNYECDEPDDDGVLSQVELVFERLDALPDDVLIDLEN